MLVLALCPGCAAGSGPRRAGMGQTSPLGSPQWAGRAEQHPERGWVTLTLTHTRAHSLQLGTCSLAADSLWDGI